LKTKHAMNIECPSKCVVFSAHDNVDPDVLFIKEPRPCIKKTPEKTRNTNNLPFVQH